MKLPASLRPLNPILSSVRKLRAFTLPEIMVVMVIFTVLVITLISCQIFGMRMHRIAETKLAATASGRKALNQVRDQIRSGKIILIGNVNGTVFSNIQDNFPMIGNAIQVYPTTNLANYVRFYLDKNDHNLKSISSTNATPRIIASYITNTMPFQAEDFRGNVLTNDDNNRVIRVFMEFYQWEYPVANIGKGAMYDYYRLQTRVTRRMIE